MIQAKIINNLFDRDQSWNRTVVCGRYYKLPHCGRYKKLPHSISNAFFVIYFVIGNSSTENLSLFINYFAKLLRPGASDLTFMVFESSCQMLVTRLFIKVPRPGDREVTFFGLWVKLHLLLPIKPLKDRGNPVNALPKDIASELAGLSPANLLQPQAMQRVW